jgi:hypothetical protein
MSYENFKCQRAFSCMNFKCHVGMGSFIIIHKKEIPCKVACESENEFIKMLMAKTYN